MPPCLLFRSGEPSLDRYPKICSAFVHRPASNKGGRASAVRGRLDGAVAVLEDGLKGYQSLLRITTRPSQPSGGARVRRTLGGVGRTCAETRLGLLARLLDAKRTGPAARAFRCACRHPTTLGKWKNGGGDRASPLIVRAAFCCGGDRRAVDDQVAVFVYLPALVPRRLGIEIEAKRRGQHGRGKILGLFTARLRGHPVAVQLRY